MTRRACRASPHTPGVVTSHYLRLWCDLHEGDRISVRAVKLKFHGTDSDTDTDILSDLSDTRAFPREDVR